MQVPPVHAQLVAEGEQVAVSVIGLLSVPTLGPETVQVGGPDTTQVNTWLGGAESVNELQFGSVRVKDAWADAPAEVRARVAAVPTSAAHRASIRFIIDSQVERRYRRLPLAPQVPRQHFQ